MNAANAAARISATANIDGLLVGGASLKADSFLRYRGRGRLSLREGATVW